jgi:hypothetical protein
MLLGAPARLCHRDSRSRTPVAKRISGGLEPDPSGEMRNRDRLESGSFRILHGEVPEGADAEHGDPLMRHRVGPDQFGEFR